MQAIGLVLGVVGAIWVFRVAVESLERRYTVTNPVLNAAVVGIGVFAFFGLITIAFSPAFMH